MKIDRLIGILSILLQKESVTAPALARHFEVSRRTISKDIDALCRAGIPIVTKQGINGGISIMDGYRIDRALLTATELKDILAGLRSLDSVNCTNRYGQLMEKLSAGSSDFMEGDQSVLIDLSSWYKETLAPKIDMIRRGIGSRTLLSFRYYSPMGESLREIEPYYLIFCWSSWYVWGWCRSKKDYRLFKLNRMDALALNENSTFNSRNAPYPDLSNERIFPGGLYVKALFDKECKWRLIEEFGSGCFEELPDGRLFFHADYTNKASLLSWLLTFGDKAELLEPAALRDELRETIGKMYAVYQNSPRGSGGAADKEFESDIQSRIHNLNESKGGTYDI